MHYITLFVNNLLPIFLTSGAGFFLAKKFRLDPRPLSQVVFYIFSPCLIFSSLVNSHLKSGEILNIMGFAFILFFLIGIIGFIATRLLNYDRKTTSAVVLSGMLMNAGNYGLPLVLFSFGEQAMSIGVVMFVSNAIVTYTIGVFIASMGTTSLKQSIINIFKVPTIYALLFAFLFMYANWQVPIFLERSIDLLGQAAIPGMMIVLGFQLANVRFNEITVPMSVSVALRMLVSPLIAFVLVTLLGYSGLMRSVLIIYSALPTAVFTTVLATEYEGRARLVTATVFLTTIISPFILTPLLSLLGA